MVEILVKGRRGSKVIPLIDDRPLVIGRNGRLRIDDQQISRKHARVVRRENAWYVEDLGSTNGTYVNHVRVTHTERVQPGDCIRIGNTSMVVRQALRSAGDTAIFVPPRRGPGLELLDRIDPGQTALVVPSARDGDATRNSWGPILLIAMLLALLISVVVNVIAYARTASALSNIEATAQRQAEERDIELVAALRSDLRKPPTGLAELAAMVEGAIQAGADQASSGDAIQTDELVKLRQSTSQELAQIRQTLDGLATKLEMQTRPMPSPQRQLTRLPAGAGLAAPTLVGEAYPGLTEASATVFGAVQADQVFPDVVFIIDASRGLAATLPHALMQVQLARSELPAHQTSRTLLAREHTVMEVLDSSRISAQSGDAPIIAEVAEQDGGTSANRAIAMALKLKARRLHLFTDNPGGPTGELRNVMEIAASRGTPLSVTHFYTREFREDLKSLARDHGGMYSFIGPR